MRSKTCVLVLALLSVSLVGVQPVDAQSLSTYDSFTSSLLNPRRWYGEEGRLSGGIRTEARRVIVSGQARIENRTWGDTFSNTGSSSTLNRLVALKSPAITVMRGTITVRSHALTACAGNPTEAGVRVTSSGSFSTRGSRSWAARSTTWSPASSSIGSQTLQTPSACSASLRSSASVPTSSASTSRCSSPPQDLGTVTVNTAATVEVRWDPANNRFVFQRDSNTPVNLTYTVADSLPASFPTKLIQVSNTVPRCTTTPRPVAFIAADFDNIMVNASTLSALAPQLASEEAGAEDEHVVDELVGPVN